MNSTELVRFASKGARPSQRSIKPSSPENSTELAAPVRSAILCARQFLASEQRYDGMWLGHQPGDASLASQLIFWLAYTERDDTELAQFAAAAILEQQRPDGGWPLTPDDTPDVSTSVQAYFALKIAGIEPSDERMQRARHAIRRLGGADAVDTTTRFFLALLGQVDYDCCPTIRPEMLLSHVHQRSGLAPLSIVWSHRPVRDVGLERGVRELFINKASDWPAPAQAGRRLQPSTFLKSLFAPLKRLCERRGWTPSRRFALDRAESQLRQHVHDSRIERLDFHELVWHAIARRTIGFAMESSEMRSCDSRINDMVRVDEEAGLVSPALRSAPIADTTLAIQALLVSGMSVGHPTVRSGIKWMRRWRQLPTGATNTAELSGIILVFNESLCQERSVGVALPPGIQISRLRKMCVAVPDRHTNARLARLRRGAASLVELLLRQQDPDGGWGARFKSPTDLCASAPEATGAALEAIQCHETDATRAATVRAVEYLRVTQRADGHWENSVGGQSVYATSLSIRGLAAAGIPGNDDAIAAGLNWLKVHQLPSGGWGRAADGGQSVRATVTETAWALLALVAAGHDDAAAARRAVEFLLEAQDDDGRWREVELTLRDAVTGRCFRNEFQTAAWALLALSRWAVAAASTQSATTHRSSFRLVGATSDN